MERKHEVITFKVDKDLAKRMKGLPNRSEFIRNALLQALQNVCPICAGTGVLTPAQAASWGEFSKNHHLEVLQGTGEVTIVCDAH
jgi:uncharacterized protein YcaQ